MRTLEKQLETRIEHRLGVAERERGGEKKSDKGEEKDKAKEQGKPFKPRLVVSAFWACPNPNPKCIL